QYDLLRSDRAMIPKAVEEMLRLASVPREIFRIAGESVDSYGIHLAGGERVALDIAAANRDPAIFADPDSFNVHRRAPAHLALGPGPHACVGSALIRVAPAAATEGLVEACIAPRIDGPVAWASRSQFRYA